MKSILRILFLGLLPVYLVSSCELDSSLDMELPEGENIPVVEAYLIEGEPLQILAYRSNTLHESVKINMIWNASVYIIGGNDSLRMENKIRLEKNTGYLYNYLLDTVKTSGDPEYSLFIEGAGLQPVRAHARPVGEVCITDVKVHDDVLEVKSTNLDNSFVNYYKLRLHSFSNGELKDVEQIIVDLHAKPEGEVTLSFPFDDQDADSLRIDLFRMDFTAYDYHRSVTNALGANRDPFTAPSPFRGNIENAMGIFTCVSRDSYTIYPGEYGL